MEIRRWTSEDPIDDAWIRPFFSGGRLDPEATRLFLKEPRNLLLVAHAQEQPVGFALAYMLERPDTPRPMLFLYDLHVVPTYRRQGAGRALIQDLWRRGREMGCLKMFVVTHEANLPAMALCETTGGQRGAVDDVVFCYPCGERLK